MDSAVPIPRASSLLGTPISYRIYRFADPLVLLIASASSTRTTISRSAQMMNPSTDNGPIVGF